MQHPSVDNEYQKTHAEMLGRCFYNLLHKPLLSKTCGSAEFAQSLFDAPFAILSHGTETDPIFNYANRTALGLFNMDWDEFTRTPSRLSAEPLNREERQRLLDRVARDGFIDDYQGVRISKDGRRFLIRNAVVWNLTDEQGHYQGQAACFSDWTFL